MPHLGDTSAPRAAQTQASTGLNLFFLSGATPFPLLSAHQRFTPRAFPPLLSLF